MPKNERYIVGLDIGTTKISCVVAELKENGSVEVVGLGQAASRGLRKGVVVNLDATVDAVKACVEEAEMMAGVAVESATVGIAGGHIRSFNSRGVIAISGKERTVSREDLRRVMDAARAVSIPQDREILHVLPQEFVLDDQGGISQPVGMTGSRLEANVHIVTAATTSIQNLVTCVNRAGVEVRDTVLEQLAASESVLTHDEKDLGVALIDIGGGTTDLAIFEKGSIWHTAVLPAGGDHFTNDLAVGLRTPIPDAERLKKKHGCSLATLVEGDDAIEVASVGGRKPRMLSRQVMAEILQPRAEEIFTLIHEEVSRAGFEKLLNAGVVLTGGGSLLPGMLEVAEQIFDLPVRLGHPGGVNGLAEPSSGPQLATAVGLALYSAHNLGKDHARGFPVSPGAIAKFGHRVRNWFAEMF
ncbi:MAG TPA: cell division protein FtsA [Candidatus Polarisedimenticolaceae bacterium]|nr:cell division protein FtsA [Candidatus Polarisedimenticolaceae bacterium]